MLHLYPNASDSWSECSWPSSCHLLKSSGDQSWSRTSKRGGGALAGRDPRPKIQRVVPEVAMAVVLERCGDDVASLHSVLHFAMMHCWNFLHGQGGFYSIPHYHTVGGQWRLNETVCVNDTMCRVS